MKIRHKLLAADFPRRLRFARWLRDRCRRNQRFLRNLVIGDEATFSMDGEVNSNNVREYAPVGRKPAFNYDRNFSKEKLNVWIGLCGNGHLIGPYFYDGNINGQR